jgi:hypothetical protein
MTSIRKLAGALCLAFCFSAYSNAQTLDVTTGQLVPGQEYSTGNIVTPTTTSGSTWTGAVYQDNLTCWDWGDPGYCGPSPIVRPGDNINFSYGSSYIFQEKPLTGIIPPVSGLQILGYNFSFTAKNGNGWDDGRTDELYALVRFWDTTGSKAANNLLYGTSYNLSYKYNWTNFSFNENFASPLSAASVGRVQYGFIGRDTNGWAGPYGPEINSVNFSLRYSVDPCSVNVLSSPSCPGYFEAMNRYTAVPVIYEPAPIATTTISSDPVVEISTTGAPSTVTAGAATTTATVATTPTAVQRERGVGPSTGQLLGIIRAEQNRLGAVENAVIQQSSQQSLQSSQDSQSQADRLATSAAQSNSGSQQATTLNAVTGSGVSISNAAVNDPAAAVNLLNSSTPVQETVSDNKTTETRRQVQDNDAAAGGISMASFAVVPIGFSAYQTALQDGQGYAPKEIYRRQRTVDNQRLLRGLTQGSDRLHEQMIDQQYQPRN